MDVGIVMLFRVISGLDVTGFRSRIIFFKFLESANERDTIDNVVTIEDARRHMREQCVRGEERR